MTNSPAATLTALPHMLPPSADARIALFVIRRMGAHGLNDARAAHAMFTAFGEAFRRPLTLMRVLMAELAANSAVPISIAPCCCARMTAAESALLSVLARIESAPHCARLLLQDVIGQRQVEGVLASAAAVAVAFADEGRPITV